MGSGSGSGSSATATAVETRPAVVAIAADGGLQFTLGELSTAIDAQVQLILIVHENGGYDEIKPFMLGKNIEPVGVDLHEPDIMMLATACGWAASLVKSLDTFRKLTR